MMDNCVGVEVNPVRRAELYAVECLEITHPDDPDMCWWSVYLRLRDGSVECVADCPTEAVAKLVATALEHLMKKEKANEIHSLY